MIWIDDEKVEGKKEEATFNRTENRKQGDTCVKRKGTSSTERFQDREWSKAEYDMDIHTLKGRDKVVFLSLSRSEQFTERTCPF
jgi:hypothetical protein